MRVSENEIYADLHTHTSCSDGVLAPERLVTKAANHDIQVLAVTDHDTVEGLAQARRAAEEKDICFVPGIELSATVQGDEVHLLAYGIDPSDAALEAHLRDMQAAREERAWTMVERLRTQGLAIEEGVLERKIATTHAVGRPHVAAALKEAGHVDTIREAFDQYIGNEGPAYVSKPDFPAAQALHVVHGAGGSGVLAHPGHWTPRAQIRQLVTDGLDGIEIWHPAHDDSLEGYYQRLARGYDLVETGGSDFHGRAEDENDSIGTIGMNKEAWERFRAAVA